MSRNGGVVARLFAGLSARSMRVVGVVLVALAGGVTALSLTTEHGLATGGASVAGATAQTGGALTASALVAFALAHPAYPAAVAFGLVLFALGDDVPLLGG